MTDMELAEEKVDRIELANRIEGWKSTPPSGPGGPYVSTWHRDFYMKDHEWDEIIAALRRAPERPSSGEMVLVPREPTLAMAHAFLDCAIAGITNPDGTVFKRAYRAMLSAAEAEGRKG